jgi:hypothetical protein
LGGYSLVHIEWEDIVTEVGWQSIEEKLLIHPCSSVGWVIDEDAIQIVLASTISTVDMKTETNNRIAIPKATIKNTNVLKVVNG